MQPIAFANDETASAEPAVILGEQAATSLEALEKASQYSFDTGGVGILISYGKKNGAPVDALGSAFVEALAKRDIQARYYYYTTERDGAALEFHIGHSALGPWSVKEAAARMKEVVARSVALKTIQQSDGN